LEPGRLGVILLGPTALVQPGEPVYRSHKVISVPVDNKLLGRVLSPLGLPLDGLEPIRHSAVRPMEMPAPGIMQRAPVSRALATGLKVVDAAIPVGLGQRQLIVGDRQTGKTSLAVDTMLNQKQTGVLCIYCAIGQRGDAVARVISALKQGQMLEQSVIINAGDEQVPGLAYLAPYAAMSIAEHFSLQGRDVLLVLDDMTHHARSYRQLSLLLRRPPGREAFPGDVFYVHARLLERAGQFTEALGGGSITALPVVETQAENLSAYIPTNLISITDGQIYLSPRLVRRNQFPAADLGLSVSRVGGKAQNKALRAVAGNLRMTLSQFEELEDFARFGTRLDDSTKARLRRGAAVRAALRQAERDPMPELHQLAVLLSAMEGLLDHYSDTPQMLAAMQQIRLTVGNELADWQSWLSKGQALDGQQQQLLLDSARSALAELPA
jgi:F-type H+-transporting ATPase subunit alpha